MRQRIQLRRGDCRDVMRALARDGRTFDAIVTDPPYELGFIGKRWDSSGVAFQAETWRAAFDVLKPGGHLLAFGGSRTFHRIAVAIEDAGFELRDTIMWIYGTGFPKSLDVSKAIDKAAGAERKVIGFDASKHRPNRDKHLLAGQPGGGGKLKADNGATRTAPATDAAREWSGWGTALKPAHEPIIVARKPLVGTVAGNVLAFGTGALNIGGCRVHAAGRWPANVIHDGSDEVEEAFGSAARFFYSAKATKAERAGSKHPTVKPLALMRYLCKLVTPYGGTVLDPFAGSGTTLQAAAECGFGAVGIELTAEYQQDIARRIAGLRKAA